jgi:hypothetical protein
MPRYIIKITDYRDQTDYYLEWSSIVDGPLTYGIPLDEMENYILHKYGSEGMQEWPARLARMQENGFTTSHGPVSDILHEVFECNRAGENEKCLDKEGLLNKYCRDQSWRKSVQDAAK